MIDLLIALIKSMPLWALILNTIVFLFVMAVLISLVQGFMDDREYRKWRKR